MADDKTKKSDDEAVEAAAEPPVRDSGPGEGARGNREVPPTTDGLDLVAEESAAEEPAEEPVAEAQPEPLGEQEIAPEPQTEALGAEEISPEPQTKALGAEEISPEAQAA